MKRVLRLIKDKFDKALGFKYHERLSTNKLLGLYEKKAYQFVDLERYQ